MSQILDTLLATEVGGTWFRKRKLLKKIEADPIPQNLAPLIHRISKILNLTSKDLLQKNKELIGISMKKEK